MKSQSLMCDKGSKESEKRCKTFQNMEQLHGNEKIVAALALLFAIHTYDLVQALLFGINDFILCTDCGHLESVFEG